MQVPCISVMLKFVDFLKEIGEKLARPGMLPLAARPRASNDLIILPNSVC